MADIDVKDSILNSTKKMLGIDPDYNVFDLEIQTFINAQFSTLNQLGVGPVGGYEIEGPDNVWSEFLNGDPNLNSAKTLIFTRVRLLFDPPETSFGQESMRKVAEELEVRLNIYGEGLRHPSGTTT